MSDREIGPVDRYNRYAEDWRFHHKLIWEIPSVSAAIFGAIIIAPYAYLELLLQSALLGVGALLIFILALAVRKHRFGADLRTNFLEDLGRDRQVFPIRSTEGLRYLRARGKRRGILNNSLEYSSERWLIGFMFAISILLASLCGLAIYQTTGVIHSLGNEGQSFSQILSVITNATRL
ncbi:MAG: hypothetical protein WBP83_01900 [Nitrososphaeraceae archaeon]